MDFQDEFFDRIPRGPIVYWAIVTSLGVYLILVRFGFGKVWVLSNWYELLSQYLAVTFNSLKQK